MSLFTDAELADLWAEHAAAHPTQLQLKATVETALDTHTWPAVTQTVYGTVLDRPGGVGLAGEIEIVASSPHKTIVLPRNTTVEPSWRIVRVDTGQIYEVDDVEPNGSFGPAVYCQCTEVPA